jgi:hypothetical protein
MIAMRRVSGVWTFLLAIFVGLGAGMLTYTLTNLALIAMLAAPAIMLLMVAACQWV